MYRTVSASRLARLVAAAFLLSLPSAAFGQVVDTVHSFTGCVPTGCQDGDAGANPRGTLALGPDGQLYGTARTDSGASGAGTLFKIASNGTMTVLFNFRAQPLSTDPQVICPMGCFPVGSLTLGSDGKFYGAAASGGLYGDGTLFNIAGGVFTKLHDFDLDQNPANNGMDGSGLTQGPDGRFYGVTQYGGTFSQSGVTLGTVYRLEPDGSITTLHSFGGSDGQWPRGDLVRATDGNIYGTTWAGGGAGGANCPYNGCGTIFRLRLTTNALEVVHAFDLTDGNAPGEGRLIQAADGSLYGTTESGGSGFANGTIFKVALDGTFTSLHSFTAVEGYGPRGSLLQGEDGNFYGTTSVGGTANKGTVFRMTPAGDVTVLHSFSGSEGARPFAGLAQGSDRHLYGVTYAGGANDLGVVFRLRLPRAEDGTLNVSEDTTANSSLSATDPSNTPLTFSIVSNGALGTATITNSATGAFAYVPNLNANGADSFRFKANNGTIDTNIATISVSIAPVNDSPVAQTGTLTTSEDTSATGTLVATDVDNVTLSYSVSTGPTKGTVLITNATTGAFTYAPTPNATGADSFTFKANDGTLDSNVASVSVTISAANDPPVASNGTASVASGGTVTGTLVATDVDNASVTYTIVSNGTKGAAVVTNSATGAYTYTANAGASGTDTFTFKANDGNADSNNGVITVTISGGNAPPIASDATSTTPEDKSVSGRLTASDPEGGRLTFALVANGTKGTASITANGRFTYIPQPNVNGSDSFTFKANDGITDSNVATVQVTISPVNDMPVASGASVSTLMNQSVSGSLQAIDADGDSITFSLVKGPRRGSVTIGATTGAFTYAPASGFSGNDSFTFQATDPAGASSTASVSIAVAR